MLLRTEPRPGETSELLLSEVSTHTEQSKKSLLKKTVCKKLSGKICSSVFTEICLDFRGVCKRGRIHLCKGPQGLRDFYLAMESLGCLLAFQIPIRSIKPAVIMSNSSYPPGNELVSFILPVNRQVFTPPKSTVMGALRDSCWQSRRRYE